ncbi:hypothetical protein SAMN05421688_2544 [Poseidonocella pacifica]|uniref:SpoIIAA-like n=1 Tax=Poseidonocella pacifica TaxID=871651 RepID=A0A1I0XVB5_9RHOB|nr:hypothetical protein [Poseidonocella pacifica]SFB04952.1 hypothetical protein SAMN05421688_2544 [Poseidonocella pacifica]
MSATRANRPDISFEPILEVSGFSINRVTAFSEPSVLYLYLLREIAPHDVAEMLEVLQRRNLGEDSLPMLIDVRGYDFSRVTTDHIRMMVQISARYPHRVSLRRGILVDSEVAYGMSRMLQSWSAAMRAADENAFRIEYEFETLLHWLSE